MNKAFLYEMLRTESVSGGEIPLQKKVAAYMREQGAEVETDLAGDATSRWARPAASVWHWLRVSG